MSKVDALIVGLALLRDRITGTSFYNSSGDRAAFYLSEPLTQDEAEFLRSIGWDASAHPDFARSVWFQNWSTK